MQRRFNLWCLGTVIGLLVTGCGSEEIERLKQENIALRAEVAALKQTAQFHYQRGQDHLAKQEWAEATGAFETVIAKYPTDSLVAASTAALAQAKAGGAAAEARQAEQERREREAAAREVAESGEEMDYATFYAKSRTGLPVGKRFRFDACLNSDATCIDARSEFVNQMICGIATDFDDSTELEAALSEGRRQCGPIVASMSYSGTVRVHRLH